MKKKSFYLILLLFVPLFQIFGQQIITDNSFQVQELIQNLVGDNCATASNITSDVNGSSNNIISYGTFNRGSSDFPFQDGIILSTGDVINAGNNGITENLSDGDINWTTDSDVLDILNIDQSLNATSIEFDFTTANNFVAFKYLFASDEYQQEYPCSFKDVFAILIKRAGSSEPYVNIAVVPNSENEVSTNSIRPNINGFCEANNEEFFEGYNLGSTNFNGQTKVLTATSEVIPNETYHIKFIIADHIDERFDSAVFIDGDSFGGSIDLGPDQSICGSDLTLNAEINNTSGNYTWFLNGSPISDESNSTLEVNESGTYAVEVSLPSVNGNCVLSDDVVIEIVPFQDALPVEDISVCDDEDNDGIYEFNFSELKDDEIFNNLPSNNYIISYHSNVEDAENNTSPIIGNYQNTEEIETIFFRIESLSGDCLQIGSFNITINLVPFTAPVTANLCDNNILEVTFANLNTLDPLITNYNYNSEVSYYLTEEDAINETNVQLEYPDFTLGLPHMIARVENPEADCYALEFVYFNYFSSPDLGTEKLVIDACIDPDYTYFEAPNFFNYDNSPITFNLEDAILEIQEEFPGADVRILVLIPGNPRLLTISDEPFTSIPIAISFDDTYCEKTLSLELHKNLLFNIIEDDKMFIGCDDASNDGIVDFDLNNIKEELSQDVLNIDVEFYENESDRDNGINEISQTEPYTVNIPSKELFIRTTYKNNCPFDSKINLSVVSPPSASPLDIEVCGINNEITNTTSIDLSPYVNTLFGAQPGITTTFHETLDDAENNENSILSIEAPGNFIEIYARLTDVTTECYATTSVGLNVAESIQLEELGSISSCDNGNDGFEIVNLVSVLDDVAIDENLFDVSYHETYENAFEDRFPILNPNSYNSTSQTIYIRVQNSGLDCFFIMDFEVIIYATPVINNIPNFINCAIEPNEASDFMLELMDDSIIDGQQNMEVLYFETELDAINRNNSIDTSVAYQNTINPQTIFVRLENELQNSCYAVAPMQLEVKQAPIYQTPNDIFECQPEPNSFASVNLSTTLSEIELGSPSDLSISFHATQLQAVIGSNSLPLNYASTSSPQTIYTRIVNNVTGCYAIETFSINTLSLPGVNFDQNLVGCADNFDSTVEWDLSDIELSILDGRQYNVDFTYYQSQEDAENDLNPIINPETYITSDGEETIFAKVRNATTNCFIIVPFDLIINLPPPVNDFQTFNVCENDNSSADLLEVNQIIVDNTFNIIISYHLSETDANSNTNAISTDFIYGNVNETLFARVQYSTTQCYTIYPFEVVVNPLPIAHAPEGMAACDDDYDNTFIFDLSDQDSQILNGQNPDDYSVTYFESEIEAINNLNVLDSEYLGLDNEIIYARVENITTGCFDITSFSLIVNSIPNVNIDDQVICLNDLPLIVSADTGNTLDTYLWSTNAISSEIEITEIGTYSVSITNEFGCELTRTFEVTESESATIEFVETIDFSDPNNITLTVEGIGDYIYQLNNLPFQDSNVFINVPIGYNTVTIVDQNGCARITREVLVIDTPKHMTPNGDGDFDTWHIAGVEVLPGTTIQIFDRFGKLLTELNHTTPGWNGTYNGNHMPAGDYWYIANIIQDGKNFQVKGHFAIKR